MNSSTRSTREYSNPLTMGEEYDVRLEVDCERKNRMLLLRKLLWSQLTEWRYIRLRAMVRARDIRWVRDGLVSEHSCEYSVVYGMSRVTFWGFWYTKPYRVIFGVLPTTEKYPKQCGTLK